MKSNVKIFILSIAIMAATVIMAPLNATKAQDNSMDNMMAGMMDMSKMKCMKMDIDITVHKMCPEPADQGTSSVSAYEANNMPETVVDDMPVDNSAVIDTEDTSLVYPGYYGYLNGYGGGCQSCDYSNLNLFRRHTCLNNRCFDRLRDVLGNINCGCNRFIY